VQFRSCETITKSHGGGSSSCLHGKHLAAALASHLARTDRRAGDIIPIVVMVDPVRQPGAFLAHRIKIQAEESREVPPKTIPEIAPGLDVSCRALYDNSPRF
jgi:hypothetical protein